jgi:signal transduction histidine kinase
MLSGNFGKMKRAMSRLVEVMEISLQRERMDEKQIKIHSNQIPFVPYLRSVLNEACELWTERQLKIDLEDAAEVFVFGDGSLLKTALLNLIDNAVKYSAEHEPVRISLVVSGSDAVFSVQNHGAVISDNVLARVFEKYYRGSVSGNTRGAGLGLYLVKKIIEQHHGRVTLESTTSDGTVAIVRLPLV